MTRPTPFRRRGAADESAADARLDVSRAVLRAMLEHMPCVVMTVDDERRVRFINRLPAGSAAEAVIGRSCLEFVAPDARQTVVDALDEALRTGQPARYEAQGSGGDHNEWFATTVLPLRDCTDGARLALLTENVTERRRYETALRDREAQLRAIVEGTTDAIHVKDAKGRYVLVNQALCLLAGCGADGILGMDDTAFLAPEKAHEVMEEDRRVMASGEVITLQFPVQRVDGEPRVLHATKGPLRDVDGTVIGVFGIARDISELLRRESEQRQALEESRNLLELTLGAAELGTWDADLINGTVRRDDRLLTMLGYERDELDPTLDQWWGMMHPEDRPMVEATRQAHLDGVTRIHESEHRLRHKDGHWVWVLESGKVRRDAAGRPIRAVGTARDISDRKRAAGESMDLLRRVEALVASLGRSAQPVRAEPELPEVRLTNRGREVLALLAQGFTSAEIARRLGISVETASTHRRNLMRRLGLRNKAELIRFAVDHRIGAAADGTGGASDR